MQGFTRSQAQQPKLARTSDPLNKRFDSRSRVSATMTPTRIDQGSPQPRRISYRHAKTHKVLRSPRGLLYPLHPRSPYGVQVTTAD